MAKNENTRKSDRNFKLDKGEHHSFDLEKKTTRQFELAKDTNTVSTPPLNEEKVVPPTTPIKETNEQSSSSRVWIWWLIGIIVIALIVFFAFKSCNSEKESQEPMVEAIENESETSDSKDAERTDETPILEDDNATTSPQEENQSEVSNVSEEATNSEATLNSEATTPSTKPDVDSAPANSQSNVKSSVSNDIEAEALKVIHGDYGIGQERKERLGSKYADIQARVNEMKRQGLF